MKQTTLNELLSKKIVTNEFIQDYENAQSLISRILVVTEEYLTNEKFRKFALNSAKSSLKKGAKATALVAVLCVTVMLNSCIGGEQKGKNPRKITPREAARLQGFPEEYNIGAVSDNQLYKQFGNSVCIPVIEKIAEEIKSALTN